MLHLRTWLTARRRLALVLVMLALAARVLVPAGFMPSGFKQAGGSSSLSIEVCADGSGVAHAVKIEVPGKPAEAKPHGACAFSALGFAALGGADGVLLAAALAFVLALGFAATSLPPLRAAERLRPPPVGPPARA